MGECNDSTDVLHASRLVGVAAHLRAFARHFCRAPVGSPLWAWALHAFFDLAGSEMLSCCTEQQKAALLALTEPLVEEMTKHMGEHWRGRMEVGKTGEPPPWES